MLRTTVQFQSTPPVWAETGAAPVPVGRDVKFQSTPPVWAETSWNHFRAFSAREFQSTPPVWAETLAPMQRWFAFQFQSTPPVWAETPRMFFCPDKPDISIHSTRVGGDGFFPYAMLYRDKISIHSTRVGGDLPGQRDDVVLPLNFNPLHPCGRRPLLGGWRSLLLHFNPLHPCGRRRKRSQQGFLLFYFNPLHPCGRRPYPPAFRV